MKNLFAKLTPFQKTEFALMLILAFSIPFYWYVAQILEIALMTCAILKIIIHQKFQFNSTQLRWKWAYIIFMLTWLVTLCGMIYTKNTTEGWMAVIKKLGFFFFPLIFLLSDMSYLTKDRIRAVFCSLTAGILVFFLTNVIWAAIDVIFNGYDTSRFFDKELMKLYYVHHSYMSMYATLAFAFCYVELFNQKNAKVRTSYIITAVMLAVFIILCNSRAGIISLVLETIILLAWTFFAKKETKAGIVTCAIILAAAGGTIKLLPESISRISETLNIITSKSTNDRRLVQFIGYKQVLKENWLFGVGTGDKYDEIVKSYESYRNKLILSIVPVQGVDKQIFEHNRDILLQEILTFTKQPDISNWHVPNSFTENFIMTDAERRFCTPESVGRMYVDYIYTTDAIANTLNTHNQYFETIISLGIIGLILLLGYFIVPIFIMIKNKNFSIIYLIFILIISFNAFFEAIFERQCGIIFFNFFNMLLLNCLLTGVNFSAKATENKKIGVSV